MPNTLDLIDTAIADLEAKLHLSPGASLKTHRTTTTTTTKPAAIAATPKKPEKKKQPKPPQKATTKNETQPDICKLEFKVGVITKVWVHPDADKLYCEEIDVGEDSPRQIASGLRPHFTEEEMLGQRLLVVSNLKAKNLVGFKSHGMVLCAAAQDETTGLERVEFVEPPTGAPVGEVVTFEGLPAPEPWSGAQVEKKKVFQKCMPDMKTTEDCVATWDGHEFMTSHGPCKTASIAGGVLR